MNLSLLIHSFDGYKHLWPGLAKAFADNWNDFPVIPVYFGTDIIPKEWYILHIGGTILSGEGEWSDRLTRLLNQIPTDYVLYMQEDHYPSKKPKNLERLMDMVVKNDLLRLQISPVNQYYTLTGGQVPLFFHPTSKYLVSHQPSIWRKDFLLSCLKPGESPWQNEYKGTIRLQEKPEQIQNRIAIYPCDWYDHKCVRGVIQK